MDPWSTTVKAIAFLDCCGYSAYTATHGDDAAVELFLGLRADVEEETAAAGVEVVKWLGDGAMLAGDAPEALAACVHRIMARARGRGALPLRAGLSTGSVRELTAPADYLGTVVNRAARRCSIAGPWQLSEQRGPRAAGQLAA